MGVSNTEISELKMQSCKVSLCINSQRVVVPLGDLHIVVREEPEAEKNYSSMIRAWRVQRQLLLQLDGRKTLTRKMRNQLVFVI